MSSLSDPVVELSEYVTVWSSAVDDVLALLDDLPDPAWALPTDLPGWDVHAVLAHLAHLEHLLAGGEHTDPGGVELGSPTHVTSPMSVFTEQGVLARRDRSPQELIAELRGAVQVRRAALSAEPPLDPDTPAPGIFGAIGWNTRTLLRNRPLDVWMHEQDIRRAVGRPGGLDSPAALHTVRYLSESLGFVVGKRVKAPAGTSVALEVIGAHESSLLVGDDLRARALERPPSDPTVRLRMDVETFALLTGGRHEAADRAQIGGDVALGTTILANMAVTP